MVILVVVTLHLVAVVLHLVAVVLHLVAKVVSAIPPLLPGGGGILPPVAFPPTVSISSIIV